MHHCNLLVGIASSGGDWIALSEGGGVGLRTSPSYRQRRLGVELRRLRESASLSSYELAARLGMKQPQLSHIEAGRTTIGADRLRTLASECRISDATLIGALVDMEQDSGKGWWSEYRGRLRPSLLDLAELEASAQTLTCYEPMFVPGLLQTEAYATAIHRRGYARATNDEHDLAVEFRMRRQRVLTGQRPPHLHAIVHEAALHPSLGDQDVMREQLQRLIEASRSPQVTVQILPFDGPVPFGTSFTLIEPPVRELSTVIVAHVEKSLYLGDAEAVVKYRSLFARLREAALPPVDAAVPPEAHAAKDSLGLIQRLLYPLL
ncbi:helix-turn-helix transcriptional regulator [Streptomyces sp. E11-3]|uniref:helix-turn-helix domain-containing protein n=1 Tax=Streptomyces sp. E11-3 TaxID=3110112 RepID=UPI003980C330